MRSNIRKKGPAIFIVTMMLAVLLVPAVNVSAANTHTIWFKPPWNVFGGPGTNWIGNASDLQSPDGGYSRMYFYPRSAEIATPADFNLGWGGAGGDQFLIDLVGPTGNSFVENGAIMDCQGFATEWFPLGPEDDLVIVVDKDTPSGGYTTSSDMILTGADPDYPPNCILYKIGGTYGTGVAGTDYLEAFRQGQTSTLLQWPAIGDANGNVYGYRVYRSSSVEAWHAIGNRTGGAAATGFTDNTCAAGQFYNYSFSVLYRGMQGGSQNLNTVVESLYRSFPVMSVPDSTPPTVERDNAISSTVSVVAGTQINVTVNATDNIGVSQVNLVYTDVDSTPYNVSMAMWSGDVTDGVWSYEIPTALVGTVTYYIWASDTSGNGAVDPAGAPGTTFSIDVIAGSPDAFVITPDGDTMSAGSNKTFTVSLYDSYGNPALAVGDTDISLSVNSPTGQFNETGTANVVTLTTVADGTNTATFDYYDFSYGTWVIQGDHGTLGTETVDITVMHLGLSYYIITESTLTPDATQTSTLTIVAKDMFNNTVLDYAGVDDITQLGASTPGAMSYTGTGIMDNSDGTGNINAGAWTNGVATFNVAYPIAGEPIRFTVANGPSNNSQQITWQVGPLFEFTIVIWDTTPTVGTPSWVNFTAKDAGGNTITAHNLADSLTSEMDGGPALPVWGGGANDLGTGDAQANPAAWVNGQLNVSITYTVAQDDLFPQITSGGVQDTGGAIIWQEDSAVEFYITVSDTTPLAGTSVTVTVTAKDQYNNTVLGYDEDCSLTQNGGSGVVTYGGNAADGQLDIGEWSSGSITFMVSYDTTYEPIYIDIEHIASGLPTNATPNIIWQPNVLDWFDISENNTAPDVGTQAMITIVAMDAYNNVIDTYNQVTLIQQVGADIPANIVYSGTGIMPTGPGTAQILAGGWTGGVAFVNVSYNIADDTTAFDFTRGLVTSSSSPITWQTTGIDHFYIVESDLAPTAGDASMLTIEAKDGFNNTVTTFASPTGISQAGAGTPTEISYTGTGVTDNADGTGQIGALGWTNGVAFVNVSYTVAYDPVTFSIGGDPSQAITWYPDNLASFYITLLSPFPVAGTPATITATAKDQFNNTIQTYSGTDDLAQTGASFPAGLEYLGLGVSDNGDGTGSISQWATGVSVFQAIYDIAGEGVQISVSDLPVTSSSPVITWVPDNLAYILVEDIAGAEVGDMPGLTADDNNVRFFSQGYDQYDNYIGNITVDWGLTGGIGQFNQSQGTSVSLDCTTPGTGIILAYIDGMFSDLTGNLTVAAGALALIAVTPTPITVVDGGTQGFNAAGFDADGNPVACNPTWGVTGGIGNAIPGPGLSTTFTATDIGIGTVTATDGLASGFADVTVIIGAPDTVAYVSGDDQAETVGTDLAQPFIVNVVDSQGNPVPGVMVVWTYYVIPAGATMMQIYSLTSLTDAAGDASTSFHLGEIAGTYAVQALAPGLTGSPVTFYANATAGAVDSIVVMPDPVSVINGGSQAFTASGYDAYGNSVAITPTWSVWNGIGNMAGSTFTATTVGVGLVNATDGGVTGSASVSVTTGPPAALSYVSGNSQSGLVNTNLALPMRVHVEDANGNPVAGVTVAWVITQIPGGSTLHSLSGATSLTDINGDATITLHLGEKAGTYGVQAICTGLTGSPVSFTATATPAALDHITVSPAMISMYNGTSQTFTAEGFDQYDNPVTISVTWAVEGGIGTLTPSGTSADLDTNNPGTGYVNATDGAVTGSATVDVLANVFVINYVQIEDAETGGNIVTDISMTTDGTLTVWAVGYYSPSIRMGLVTVDWTTLGTLDPQTSTATNNFTFDPTTARVLGAIRATYGTMVATTGIITVDIGALDLFTVYPGSMTITADETAQFTTRGYDADGNLIGAVTVTWSLYHDSVSPGVSTGSISSSGLFTPVLAMTWTVNATHATLGTVSAAVTVTVGDLAGITVNPGYALATAGQTVAFSVSGLDSKGNALTVTSGAQWFLDGVLQSSNSLTSTVSGNHTVTALLSGLTATGYLEVGAAAGMRLIIDQSGYTISADDPFQFTVSVEDVYGNVVSTVPTLDWTAENGTIDDDGLFTPWSLGTWDIEVMAVGYGADTVEITVYAGVVSRIVIVSSGGTGTRDSDLTVGESMLFTVNALDIRGNLVSVPASYLTWSTDVGSVSGGLFTALTDLAGAQSANGTVDVEYDDGTTVVSGTEIITVNIGPVHHIVVTADETVISVNENEIFSAVGYDIYNNQIAGLVFAWAVTGNMGTVGTTGTFSALREGSGTVTATSGGVTGSLSVYVPAPSGIFTSWLWLVIILLIVVLILAVLLILGRRKEVVVLRQEPEEEPEEEVEEDLAPTKEVPEEFMEPLDELEEELGEVAELEIPPEEEPEVAPEEGPKMVSSSLKDQLAEELRVERCEKMLTAAVVLPDDKEKLKALIATGISAADFTEEVKKAIEKRKKKEQEKDVTADEKASILEDELVAELAELEGELEDDMDEEDLEDQILKEIEDLEDL